MKTKLIIMVIGTILIAGQYVFAHEGMDHDESMESKGSMMGHEGSMMQGDTESNTDVHVATKEELETLPNIGNKICPVSGDKIPAPGEKSAMGEVVKYEYNGKIYNLCCTMCIKDFKKDPEKYNKIAEEEVEKSEEQGKNEEHKESDGHEHHNHGK